MNLQGDRIKILDGFRAIAILSVMLYHYFSRWTPPTASISYYPYNNQYDFFRYGNIGVPFFFIISGFVISYTLEHTSTFGSFWKKRFIRLYPSMIVASTIIFLALSLFDETHLFKEGHQAKNFLSSLTFLPPAVFNRLFSGEENESFSYINMSFWSLWPEIQFYVLCSVLYYGNKKNFLQNFIAVSFAISISHWLFLHIIGSNKLGIILPGQLISVYKILFIEIFNLNTYLLYFSIGVLFRFMFKDRKEGIPHKRPLIITLFLFIILQIYFSIEIEIRMLNFILFILFGVFVYYPHYLTLLSNRWISETGMCSYFLYLIHEPLGVLLINRFGTHFSPFEFLFPLAIIVFFTICSIYYYKIVEKKTTTHLSNYLYKRR